MGTERDSPKTTAAPQVDVQPLPKLAVRDDSARAWLPMTVDLGEVLTDTDHTMQLPTPTIAGSVVGRGLLEHVLVPLYSNEEASTEMRVRSPSQIDASSARNPVVMVSVSFRLKTPGLHDTRMKTLIRWPDGVTSEMWTLLRLRARTLEHAPERPLAPAIGAGAVITEPDATPVSAAELSKIDRAAEFEFNALASHVEHDVGGLSTDLAYGAEMADKNIESYKQMPPQPDGALAVLSEAAILWGVGAVTAILAKLVEKGVGSLAMKWSSATEKGKVVTAVIPAVTDGLKDGLDGAFSAARASARQAKSLRRTPEKIDPDSDEKMPVSDNPAIAYYAKQKALALGLGEHQMHAFVRTKNVLMRQLAKDREVPFAALQAVRDAVAETRLVAWKKQQLASETNWVSFVSRYANATEVASDRSGRFAQEVTAMSKIRDSSKGVVEIVFEQAADGGLSPKSAALKGISQEVASRLSRVPLKAVAVPLLLVRSHGGYTTRITRDEVGRVRIMGVKLGYEDGQNEAQRVQQVTPWVERMLSKSLAEQGVTIQADDETGVAP